MKTLIDTPNIECPAHEGAFDCNSFCRLCEGEQETNLESLIEQSHSLSWDGCHKLYLNMDYMQTDKMVYDLGYTLTIRNDEPNVTMQKVEEWFADSCGLRFIDAVFTNDDETDKFVTVVAQFELDEDEEEND